jgi:hypothetical protein
MAVVRIMKKKHMIFEELSKSLNLTMIVERCIYQLCPLIQLMIKTTTSIME